MNITIVSLWAQKLFRQEETQPFGGAELQLVLLARALSQRPDVTVRMITRGQGAAESFLSDNIHVYKLPFRHRRETRSWLGAWDCLRACMNLPTDVLIQRGGGYETGITAFAARIRRIPFLFMTSSTWDVDGTHECHRGKLYGKTYLYGLRRSSALVTQTKNQYDLLLTRYGRNSTILRSAHPIPDQIPKDKRGVLWVGRCEPCKNPELFIAVAKNLTDIPCTMVCPPANLSEMYKKIETEAATVPSLRFLPGVSFEETEALFATHKIMVNTSTQEGYPNTYVQSLKWGVPIVTAQFDPDEILETHQMGIRTGNSEEFLTQGVRDLLNEEERWLTYSQNARDYAIKNHDIRSISTQLYTLLHSLISSPQKRVSE